MPTPDPLAPLRSLLTSFVYRVCDVAVELDAHPTKKSKRQYIAHINREAERILRAIRAAAREHVRQLPGRAQKGAVLAAVRSVTPKIARALRV